MHSRGHVNEGFKRNNIAKIKFYFNRCAKNCSSLLQITLIFEKLFKHKLKKKKKKFFSMRTPLINVYDCKAKITITITIPAIVVSFVHRFSRPTYTARPTCGTACNVRPACQLNRPMVCRSQVLFVYLIA